MLLVRRWRWHGGGGGGRVESIGRETRSGGRVGARADASLMRRRSNRRHQSHAAHAPSRHAKRVTTPSGRPVLAMHGLVMSEQLQAP
jgi:hypothetical protein